MAIEILQFFHSNTTHLNIDVLALGGFTVMMSEAAATGIIDGNVLLSNMATIGTLAANNTSVVNLILFNLKENYRVSNFSPIKVYFSFFFTTVM